jgi:hypothetical protein
MPFHMRARRGARYVNELSRMMARTDDAFF